MGSEDAQDARESPVGSRRCKVVNMVIDESLLTHDERKAAEAAFRALPLNSQWSQKAQLIYLEILQVTGGRDIVTQATLEHDALVVGV